GNCQASNKTKGSVGRLGLLFYLLFVGERSPEQDKSAGSGFERCAATARRVAGRTPAINCQASNKKNPVPEGAGFFAVWRIAPPVPVALRLPGLQSCSPEKVRSTASGESRCHSNVNERLSRKAGPFVLVFYGQTRRRLPR
ncbi:hypothetical protein RBG07_23515, partial [Klebsiella aerogenes]|uniref:hypothetical protein n=1 Tax=Klebsiella aerogenes TaxID=548 RepID=UPI0028DF12D6